MLSEQEFMKISELESSHWWYRNLHDLTLDAVRRYRAADPVIIDAGCGTGGLLLRLRETGYHQISGFDQSQVAVSACKSCKLPVEQGDLRTCSASYAPESADIIISNDTLYFFQNEGLHEVIRQFHQILRPGGRLIVNLPAFNAFRGPHDEAVGITRRFEPDDIPVYFTNSLFTLTKKIYWPFLLAPMIWADRAWKRNRGSAGSDLKKEPAWLNQLLGNITSFENKGIPRLPFGSSLFMILEKTSS